MEVWDDLYAKKKKDIVGLGTILERIPNDFRYILNLGVCILSYVVPSILV